jgi:hypothetical protein
MNISIYISYVDNLKWNDRVSYPLACDHYTVKARAKVDDNEIIVSFFSRKSTPAFAIYKSLEYLSKIHEFPCSYSMCFDEYKDKYGIIINHTKRQYYGVVNP